jgi:hypothetical protein
LEVLQDGPAKTVDRLRPHGRMGLDPGDDLVLGDVGVGDAADLLAAAKKVGAPAVDQAAERLVERVGLSGTSASLQTKAAPLVEAGEHLLKRDTPGGVCGIFRFLSHCRQPRPR